MNCILFGPFAGGLANDDDEGPASSAYCDGCRSLGVRQESPAARVEAIRSVNIQLLTVSSAIRIWRPLMRISLIIGALALATLPTMQAYPQTQSGAPSASSNQPTPPSTTSTKRSACQASTQALTGQDKRDQMRLCMAQARMDCLRQAIDKKIFGAPRKDFVNSCMGEQPAK
jgi:hypothetical protein